MNAVRGSVPTEAGTETESDHADKHEGISGES
jgi:hypothetical protein